MFSRILSCLDSILICDTFGRLLVHLERFNAEQTVGSGSVFALVIIQCFSISAIPCPSTLTLVLGLLLG